MKHHQSSSSTSPQFQLRLASLCVIAVMALAMAQSASAQIACGQVGPDIIKGEIPAIVTNFASTGDIDIFSIGYVHCNIGSAPVASDFSNNNHFVSISNVYRLKPVDGAPRFEQIGMSWVLHSFFSLSNAFCCTGCTGTNGATLGVNCSDSNTSWRVGQQSVLRPRYLINSATGAFPFPQPNLPFEGNIARRMQVKHADLDPALNSGAQYFAEAASVAPDDAVFGNDNNNASYRPCQFTGSGEYNIVVSGTTVRGEPAIHAWKVADASVTETNLDVPNDGRFIIAAKATDLGSGVWRYEYAVENLNSHESARTLSVPVPPDGTITNIGFHDVDYHDGDGEGNVTRDGTDWNAAVIGASIEWSTHTFAANPNANALRWGTLYNFRFDCNSPPQTSPVTIGTYRTPGSVSASSVGPIPNPLPCPGDIVPPGGDGWVNVDDLLAVINSWGPCRCPADVAPPGGNGYVNVDDLLLIINAWGQCH